MKELSKKLYTIAVTLLVLMLTACEDSLDNNFLNDLAAGKASAELEMKDHTMVQMDYREYLNGSEEWIDKGFPDGGTGLSRLTPLIIYKGRSCQPIVLETTASTSKLYYPWKAYCKQKGYEQPIYLTAPVIFDEAKQKLTIRDMEFDILHMHDSEMSVRVITLGYGIEQAGDELKPMTAYKHELTLVRKSLAKKDVKGAAFFTSVKDAKLYMIKLIRDELGDRIDVRDYLGSKWIDPEWAVYDLAQLEEDIRNNIAS